MIKALFLIILVSMPAAAQICPTWIKSKVGFPPCPKDATLLDDSYPLTGLVISDQLGARAIVDPKGKRLRSDDGVRSQQLGEISVPAPSKNYVWSVVKPLLIQSQRFPPKIYLVGTQETVDFLKRQIATVGISKEAQKEFLNSISLIPVEGQGVWFQDFFEPVVNTTGGVSIRPFQAPRPFAKEAYERYAKRIAAAGAACGVVLGDIIGKDVMSHTQGGNVEPGGGGICLIGSKDFIDNRRDLSKIGAEFCSNPRKIIEVPTDELYVGHADEVIKSISFENSPRGCKATYLIASPRKALELLGSNASETLVDQEAKDRSGWDEVERASQRSTICGILDSYWNSRSESKDLQKEDSVLEGFLFFSKAHASSPKAQRSEPTINRFKTCMAGGYTNGDLHRAIQGARLIKDINSKMQKKYDDLKETVSARIRSEVGSKCQVEFIDTPHLFIPRRWHAIPKTMTAETLLNTRQDPIQGHSLESLFPNIINSVTAEKLLLSTDPNNPSFRKFMKSELAKRGFKTENIDAVNAGGNLHCMTHEIRGCLPQ